MCSTPRRRPVRVRGRRGRSNCSLGPTVARHHMHVSHACRTSRTGCCPHVPAWPRHRCHRGAAMHVRAMGKEAVKLATTGEVNRLGDIAAESGRIPKGAFVRWVMQLLSATVRRGNADMYRRSGLIISREQGLRYDAGCAVPVLMS